MNAVGKVVALRPEDLLEGDPCFDSPPQLYGRIQRLIEQPGGSIARIVELIERDPALSARLLRVANSAFFPWHHPVGTIYDTVALLGTRELNNLVLAAEVIQGFDVPRDVLDIYAFWHESLRCAVLARLLARRAAPAFEDDAFFIPALLHGIGQLVICRRLPELGRAALEESRGRGLPLHEAQRRVLGIDYAEVGMALAARWHLAPRVVSIIANHVSPERGAGFMGEAALVHLALAASRAGNFQPHALLAAVPKNPVLWRLARLGPEDLVRIAAEADEAFRGALGLFH